jgi:hypothetical protein
MAKNTHQGAPLSTTIAANIGAIANIFGRTKDFADVFISLLLREYHGSILARV